MWCSGMDRRWRTGVLLQTLICWTLIGLCCAGHRPLERGERHRYARHHDRRAQRIQYPSLNDQGTQRIEYPSVNDQSPQRGDYPSVQGRGQIVQYPNVNDSAASSQIKRCAPGFYRDDSGAFLGRCVPCDCNGLSDVCEESTGRCLNCQYNTAGERCERCKEGYYGNPILRTCRVCPCPFSVPTNSFAIGCREAYNDFQCICKAGYTGDKCQRCAPGYYGNPLVPGGSCRPCNCNGNGNNCDPQTGVCKNTFEPGDTNTDESCQECDSCAQTLLHDLEKLDDDLRRVENEMYNATASTTSQDRLKKLEKAVSDTKILVNRFSNTINTQRAEVDQLDRDTFTLADDINSLKEKADKTAADSDDAVSQVEKTNARAKDLDTEIKNMLKKIQALLNQLNDAGGRGDNIPTGSLANMLEDAQRMVKEMENRNFTPQKTAAEKERDEAKKLLDYIQANVSKQLDQNQAAAGKIQDLLKEYDAKLKELDSALKEARDLVKKANTLNGLNAKGMQDLQKRIDDLNKERKTVEDQMSMAENELQNTEDLVKMLTDSKTEYEQLAAQLDGAKTELSEKVNEISKAAAKEDIVVKAEEHARNLEEQARDLEKAVKNASGLTEVRNAKDAIDVYKNITDAINAAEAAAGEAKVAAEKALDNVKKQNLLERAQDLKLTGNDLLQNAKQAEEDSQGTEGELTDVKNRLKNAGDKKTALEKELLDIQKQLNDTKRDDIGNMIDEAKRKAALANDTASKTMDRLNDIKKELDKINVSPVDANLSSVLNNVDQTVKKLLNNIPQLDNRLSEMENLTSGMSPISNITEDIKKIKELIEQARDAANRIVIPMKFTGSGYVEMRAPQDLEDLRAYTSMALSLQRPVGGGDGRRRRRQASGDMFVLYLGNRDSSKNYIGMYLKSNTLYGEYKLNGKPYPIETVYITRSAAESSRFDRVELSRIYQDMRMNLTKDITSVTPPEPRLFFNQGNDDKNLLDLSPSDVVFYVGGYPDNFTPPTNLNLPKYDGCIEFASFNDKVVSLYNFKKAEGVNLETPCKRYVAPVDTSYFEGTGYGRVDITKTANTLLISMSLFTRLENGLLLYMGNENNYFMVTIEKGFLLIGGNLIQTPAKSDKKLLPLSEWKDVLIIIRSTRDVSIRFGGDTIKADASYSIDEFTEYYIGGTSQDLRERYNITIPPFKGCMSNMKQQRDFKAIDEQVGISKGCPVESLVSRKAEFSLGSSLSADLNGFSVADDVTVSVGFKSTYSQGHILQTADKGLANWINLALDNGYAIVSVNNVVWKSNKQYNDGQWHYLTVTKKAGSIGMLIDDEDSGQKQSSSASATDTNGSLFLGKDTFRGCISNLYTRRPENLYKPEDLNSFTSTGDVLLDVCTAWSPVQLMLDRSVKKR